MQSTRNIRRLAWFLSVCTTITLQKYVQTITNKNVPAFLYSRVQPDWGSKSGASSSYKLNKPLHTSHIPNYYIVFSLCCCPVSKYHYTTTTYIYCNNNSNKKEEMSRENPRRRNRRREVQRRVCENSGIFFPSVMYYVRPWNVSLNVFVEGTLRKNIVSSRKKPQKWRAREDKKETYQKVVRNWPKKGGGRVIIIRRKKKVNTSKPAEYKKSLVSIVEPL